MNRLRAAVFGRQDRTQILTILQAIRASKLLLIVLAGALVTWASTAFIHLNSQLAFIVQLAILVGFTLVALSAMGEQERLLREVYRVKAYLDDPKTWDNPMSSWQSRHYAFLKAILDRIPARPTEKTADVSQPILTVVKSQIEETADQQDEGDEK